jgi:hypothetical protein
MKRFCFFTLLSVYNFLFNISFAVKETCPIKDLKSCEYPRLIIGSGKKLNKDNNIWPLATPITNCDYTVNNDTANKNPDFPKLNPDCDIDIKENFDIFEKQIVNNYKNVFKEIIFEHVGWGFASIAKDKKNYSKLLQGCNKILKNGGILKYKSFRANRAGLFNTFKPIYALDLSAHFLIERNVSAIPLV